MLALSNHKLQIFNYLYFVIIGFKQQILLGSAYIEGFQIKVVLNNWG